MSKLDAKDLKEFLKPENKTPDGKIKSLVTGESIKTFFDYDTISNRDKEVVETVLNQIDDLKEKNLPDNIIKEKIIQDFKIKQVPLVDYKKSLFWKYAKDKNLGVTQQGYRNTLVNNEPARMPILNFTADLDYLDAWVEEILTEASNLKTILNNGKDE